MGAKFGKRRYVFQIFGQEEKLLPRAHPCTRTTAGGKLLPRALLLTTTRNQRERLTGDLGSGNAVREIDPHDIAGGEGAAAAGFYLAIDRNLTGLDEHARLGTVLYQVR